MGNSKHTIVKIITASIASAVLTLIGISSVFAADLTVRFAWYMPVHTATDQQANEVAKKIEAYSKGAIKVLAYPSGSLFTEKNIGDALRNQSVQMAILGMHWWSNVEPSLQWDNIPFLLTDPEVGLKALHGEVGKEVNKILAEHNVVVIGWGYYGYGVSYINNKHPVRRPEDLRGLTLRGDGPLTSAFITKFGGSPVAMSSSGIYTALQRGVMDGAASGLPSFISRRWIEVAKNVTALRDIVFVYPVQANLKWWESLTNEQRSIISKAVADTEEDNVRRVKSDWDQDIAQLKKEGGKVVIPAGADLKEWKEGTAFLTQWYLKKAGEKGQKILETFQKYVP